MLVAWVLAWVPHGFIAVGFAVAGDAEASLRSYQEWASRWPGLVGLGAGALILFGHFALGALGFGMTGRALLHRRRRRVSP